MRTHARCLAAAAALGAVVLGGCGGNALKDKADDAVRGTGFEVQEITEFGDDAGRVTAVADDGSEIDFSIAKDAGELAIDGCDQLNEGGYGCVDLNEWP
jgi:outer membrane murein-binding lipoprotein Lpp